MEERRQAESLSEGSRAGSKTRRRPVFQERADRKGRRRAAGRYFGPGSREGKRQAGLHLLSRRNRQVQADNRDDRKEDWSRDGAELEYGAEAGCDCESRLVAADPRGAAQANRLSPASDGHALWLDQFDAHPSARFVEHENRLL